jgi:hypothetical protein
VAGDGRQSRAFVYVEDLADGVVRALAPVAANRTYNLAAERETSIGEIAEAVQDVVRPVGIEHVPGRGGDFAGARVSCERAERELGWTAVTPLREGLRRYVEWHLAQLEPAPARRPLRVPIAAWLGAALLAAWVLAAMAGLAVLDPLGDALGLAKPVLWAALIVAPLVAAVLAPRGARRACWGVAGAEAAAALLPWPGPLGRAGHAHETVLLLGALVALVAADAAGRRGLLRPVGSRT